DARLFQVNVQAFDAHKHDATPVVGDARSVIQALRAALDGWHAPADAVDGDAIAVWNASVDAATQAPDDTATPSDAQVIGAVQASFDEDAIVVGAAGGLP